MKKLTANEMRKLWFTFFENKKHEVIESAPLIPENDPTLLWINAGVTPLKKYFDGSIVPNNRRMASSQKCIRTNDIELVGKTARHQTFFEMLGNFSIGDYFKKEAIPWAFEFLTSKEYLDIDKDKLYMTIYPTDQEARDLWLSVGVDADHIIPLEDNFWEIGPGPSGPDSEIFYDRGETYDKDHLGIRLLKEDIENDRYIEIWNNVFSQYNAKEGVPREEYPELPSKNIDTGMGLERIISILQGVETNFDTDLFLPIMNRIGELCGTPYDGTMPFKVIGDHIRAITFALADGANFGNTGRDYVLRRLLRRATRYGKKLGMTQPFLKALVPVVVEVMKEAYPYLEEKQDMIQLKINKEEELFIKTLENGEKRLQELFENNSNHIISGEEAFRLYDTYGFPFELTEEMALEHGFTVSKEEFETYMKQQQELAKASRNTSVSMNCQNEALLSFKEESSFVGYEQDSCDTRIIALFEDEKFVEQMHEGYLVCEKSPFYVEAGGQVSDSGVVIKDGIETPILDVFQGPNGQIFHHVVGEFNKGDQVTLKIDSEKREQIRKNHSAVHLLQKSLQQIISPDIHQAGSYVDENNFRFDFIYEGKISKKDIVEVENKINEKIQVGGPIITEIMKIEEAKETGAMALFDAKYKEDVRVVSMSDSKELCGGTHARKVEDLGRCAIRSIESKGSNVYRVEGTTDTQISKFLLEAIQPYNEEMIVLLEKAKTILKDAVAHDIALPFDYSLFDINHDAPKSYLDVLDNLEEVTRVKEIVACLEKEYKKALSDSLTRDLSRFEQDKQEKDDYISIISIVEQYDMAIVKQLVDQLSNQYDNSLVALINRTEHGLNFIVKSKVANLHAGNILAQIAPLASGRGGGSATYAQGGGNDASRLDEIIKTLKSL